jgi:hypothetical protein
MTLKGEKQSCQFPLCFNQGMYTRTPDVEESLQHFLRHETVSESESERERIRVFVFAVEFLIPRVNNNTNTYVHLSPVAKTADCH